MALGEEGNSGIPATMLVGPATVGTNAGMPYPVYYGNGSSNSGNNGWDSGWWIILLFILLASGNWGNNGQSQGGFFGGAPVVVNDGGSNSYVQRGFDQAAIMGGINAIQSGVTGVSTQLCNGFADVNATINATAANAETAANARAMANMQQLFGLQTQFADCCCENRLASADLKYTIATENCADRYASAQNTRDIIENCNRNNQAILDKLCQLELDGKNDRIADLERQLTLANMSASQVAQTAQIQKGQVEEVDALYQRLKNCPVPAMPVYGMQPVFTCGGNGCGCGNTSF